MYGKATCTIVIVLFLIVAYSIYIGTVDLRPYFFPLLQSPPGPSSSCLTDHPLRVYMYDLPRKFHVGMLDSRSSDVMPLTAENFPSWPSNSGIKRQHSVEYWLMASLFGDSSDGEEREAVRVLDPDFADAFFVPFFSSLSFNTHGKNMTDPETEVDRQLQEGIIRVKLEKMLSGYDDVHFERSVATTKNIKASTQGMRSSKFCLHPAGDTPSSCRLFDAIVSHCVPVIVSDKIELPFEDEIDYSEFSVFFSVKEALQPDSLVNELRRFPKERWVEMWGRLKNISHHYEFQHPTRKDDAVNMLWKQIKNKLPQIRLAVHRNRRLKVPDWWQ
ncbi:probable arabinosyltransferase ARAD1 isoform X3 [Carica papaya]|uniref:probable arabinosyltransferase ARAD1 isoform X3 n=1 Tax=Carica papaya TaxID=3649 RepID=UPI000B8CA6EE|nr:probable arabinosyltransferase ARAD1 isoform X3 [Carica papaya]